MPFPDNILVLLQSAIFIVIPGNELYKIVIERNASSIIKGGRVGVTGDNLVLNVAPRCPSVTLGCVLQHLLDVIKLGSLLQGACQMQDGHIGGKNPEGMPWVLTFSMVVKTPIDSMTSNTPFDVSEILLLEDADDFPIYDKLPILMLDCAIELAMGRVILEHVDRVVKVNVGVIGGNNLHFARTGTSPDNQAANTAKCVCSDCDDILFMIY
ncbi:hypothetical protein I79_020425 [Cricetulus griseus]|uniref:Ubiquitin-60S ribosomal protein L40 n=1 Tax=Cricetulus griseus TaxID=10029 RepID=G3IA09_CRIGR|nr:hypothetical protein I79_020425 [Cricetulus griseus]ERE84505.1 ubiquitin-60S ribosomal protein L40 [Cricetulus griseus]